VFYYHLGDVIYLPETSISTARTSMKTYKDYPAFIISIPGNHDCQPDDPQDGPVESQQISARWLDTEFHVEESCAVGLVEDRVESNTDGFAECVLDLHDSVRTILGLFSNVGETEAEIHQDQIDWFKGSWRLPIRIWP